MGDATNGGWEMDAWGYAVAGFLRATVVPVVVAAVLAVPLWLIRRYYPKAERYVYGPLFNVFYAIGRSVGRLFRRRLPRGVRASYIARRK